MTSGSARSGSRLLKKAHLLGPILRMGTPHAQALVAAYLGYAWTHLRWVPRLPHSALHLDLFEQPAKK
jgi:hypothetical protein